LKVNHFDSLKLELNETVDLIKEYYGTKYVLKCAVSSKFIDTVGFNHVETPIAKKLTSASKNITQGELLIYLEFNIFYMKLIFFCSDAKRNYISNQLY
jgi:hypothetical protein